VPQGAWTDVPAEKHPAPKELHVTTRTIGTPPPAPAASSAPACQKHAAPRLAAHETTVAEYAACVRAGKCTPNVDAGLGASYPVTGVRLAQARAYCAYAGTRLPTDEEWTAAITADCPAWPKRFACMTSEAGYELAPVGAHPDDAVDGRFDLFGNAMELTNDGTVRGTRICAEGSPLRAIASDGPDSYTGFRCLAP
jgi:formylglycine-generating enzyme required for sulfatase activity